MTSGSQMAAVRKRLRICGPQRTRGPAVLKESKNPPTNTRTITWFWNPNFRRMQWVLLQPPGCLYDHPPTNTRPITWFWNPNFRRMQWVLLEPPGCLYDHPHTNTRPITWFWNPNFRRMQWVLLQPPGWLYDHPFECYIIVFFVVPKRILFVQLSRILLQPPGWLYDHPPYNHPNDHPILESKLSKDVSGWIAFWSTKTLLNVVSEYF